MQWTPLALVRRSAAISPWLTGVVGALVVVSGLLPAAFTVATGVLAGAVGDRRAVGGALAAVTAIYVLIQVAGPVRAMATDILVRRMDASVASGLMNAVSTPRGIAHLEDPHVLNLVAQAQGIVTGRTVGSAVSHLASGWALRLQGVVSLVIVARFRWWLAPLLASGHAASYAWRRRHWMDVTRIVFARTDELRHADYLRRLALRPEAAKESRVFSLAGWLVGRYRDGYLATMRDVWRERRVGALPALAVAVLLLALEGYALVLVARAGVDASITLAAAVVYAQAVLGAGALGVFDMDDMFLQESLASFRQLQELEATLPGAVVSMSGELPADGLPQQAISFQDVRFRYPGQEEAVFDGLDLEIVAGQSLAIVGVNGAGKTTLIKLLARLYDVDGGRITVDGKDLRELDPAAWQRRVAAIFQDFVQYPVSAADNVAFGALAFGARAYAEGDREAVVAAARRAGALEVIEGLPGGRGWDTVLNRQFTGGAELSGGEWQRVALARALFAVSAGAGVLVLDEPTASLDVRAEADLYDRFHDLTRGVTTIVVSHRFSTVRRAERIVVLDRGRVVEDGSHDELVARGGHYATMYGLQASRFSDGG